MLNRIFLRCLEGGALIVFLFLLLGLAGRYWYLFDLLSHFRIQYLACLALAGMLLLIFRAWISAALCFLAAGLFAVPIAPYFRQLSPPDLPIALKLISYNVNTANRNHAAVRDYLRRENADVIFLMEVNDLWINSLAELADLYPHTLIRSRSDNFGVALLSKYPFESATVSISPDYHLPSVQVKITINQELFTIFGTHPLPPMNGFASASRDQQLKRAARSARQEPGHVLLVGDFNLTPYSPVYTELLRQSRLKDSAIGFGLPPTWQANIPVLAIPIDQALVSDSITVLSRHTGPRMGSDHCPLVLTVGTAK